MIRMNTDVQTRESQAWSHSIESGLKSRVLGRPLIGYEETTSTNDVLKRLAIDGAPEGLTVVAQSQTSGRGRQGRGWASIDGQGVYMSVLLRPELQVADVGWLSMLGGVSVLTALEELGVADLSLKWPNDVLARGRKISGILIEPRIGEGKTEFAVVGVGINVGQHADSWQDDMREIATSCRMEGIDLSVETVLARTLEELDRWYMALKSPEREQLVAEWVKRGGTSRMPVVD